MSTQALRAGERLFLWLLLGFSLFILFHAYKISGFESVSSPGAFPLAAATVMVLSIAVTLAKGYLRRRAPAGGLWKELSQARRQVLPGVVVIYTLLIGVYMWSIEPLHFLMSTFLFLVVSLVFLRRGGVLSALAISAAGLASIYVIFHYIFRVILP